MIMKKLLGSAALRMIFSFVVVFLIPVFVLYMMYTSSIVSAVRQNVEKIVSNDLAAAVQINDEKIRSLDDTVKMFQRGNGYQSYLTYGFSYDETGNSANTRMESDVTYIYLLNSLPDDFFVIIPDVDTVMSVSGMHRVNSYFSKYFMPTGETAELWDWASTLGSGVRHNVSALELQASRGEASKHLAFSYSLPKNAVGRNAIAVFSVDTDKLSEALHPRTEDFQTSTFVFDKNGSLLFSHGADETLTKEICLRYSENALSDGRFLSAVTQEEYTVISKRASQRELVYITLLPNRNELYTRLFEIEHFSNTYMLLTSIVGLLAICFVFWFNYKPIRTLREKAKATVSVKIGEMSPHITDDYGTISNVLTVLQERNAALGSANLHNAQEIAAFRLQRLVNGYYTDLREFNDDCEQIGLYFTGNRFYISIIHFSSYPDNLSDLAEAITPDFEGEELQFLPMRRRSEIAIIHSLASSEEYNKEPFYSVLGTLHDKFSVSAAVGIGHVHEGTSSINKSFMQAKSSIEHSELTGAAIVDYDEVLSYYADSYKSQKKRLHDFSSAVLSKNTQAINKSLSELLSSLSDPRIQLITTRYICFDVIKLLMSGLDEHQKAAYMMPEILIQISYSNHKKDILNIVSDTCTAVLESWNINDSISEEKLLNQIRAYIDSNYTRCDFSLQELSDHFEMLPSSIGSFFKKRTGYGLLDYLIEKRVDKAKTLLRESDMAVKDISIAVGYYNDSSFIRRFKQHEGMTPNAYRFQGK